MNSFSSFVNGQPVRTLVSLPVYNEVRHIMRVLDEVLEQGHEVLVVDDGSSDGTSALLKQRRDIQLVCHEKNKGYGAALRSAFDYARQNNFDFLVTIDSDGQHQPRYINEFIRVMSGQPTCELPFTPHQSSNGPNRCEQRPIDMLSGSRYLKSFDGDNMPPIERRRINVQITSELNACLGLNLTDAFCGFKAYRVATLAALEVNETGYAMPLELWVRAAHAGLRIEEIPVPLVYLDENRSFGAILDDGQTRLAYYHSIIDRTIDELNARFKRGQILTRHQCCSDIPETSFGEECFSANYFKRVFCSSGENPTS